MSNRQLSALYESYGGHRETYKKIVDFLKKDGEIVGENTHADCGDGGPRRLTTLHCNGVTIHMDGVSVGAYRDSPAHSELHINLASNNKNALRGLTKMVKSIDKNLVFRR